VRRSDRDLEIRGSANAGGERHQASHTTHATSRSRAYMLPHVPLSAEPAADQPHRSAGSEHPGETDQDAVARDYDAQDERFHAGRLRKAGPGSVWPVIP